MITDRLKNASQYYSLGARFQKGFEFLLNSDLASLVDGRYEIDGDKIFANIQTLKTKSVAEKKWEVHRKYIDIQYVIKGSEKMGYGILDDFGEVVEEYNKDRDLEFLNGNKFNFIDVAEGDFVIFYPHDVHAPMLSVVDDIVIKKVIVKIAL